jgi:ParB family chromosome partitioning protein
MRAGLATVPVIIRESTPQEMLEIAIIENVQRSDLNPIEEALAYQALKDEFQLSDDQISKRMGRSSRVQITNTRRLLRLCDEAQSALRGGQISAGHGRCLLKLEHTEQQRQFLNIIIKANLTVREAEQITDFANEPIEFVQQQLDQMRNQTPPPARTGRAKEVPSVVPELSTDDRAVARELESHIGTPVQLQRTARDVRLTFVFHSDEKLQEFLELLARA